MVRINIIYPLVLGSVTGAFQSASFTNSAAPSVASSLGESTPSSVQSAHRRAILSGYTPNNLKKRSNTVLFAKKKRGAAAVKGGKVQVKILKHVEGTGRVGDVVSVSPAFWENKLKKTGSAIMITDEEVLTQKKEAAAVAEEALDHANHVKEKIEGMGAIAFAKKAGPDGHLFGGINKKSILLMLQSNFPNGALSGKAYKVLDVKDESGSSLNHDIKEVGEYQADISLHPKVDVRVKIIVTFE